MVLLALGFVYFGVVRPLIRNVAPANKDTDTFDEDGDDDVIVQLNGAPPGLTFDDKLARAKEVAQSDPKMIANLIKDWMGTNDEGKK